MLSQCPCSRTLNPSLSVVHSPSLTKFPNPLYKTIPPIHRSIKAPKSFSIRSLLPKIDSYDVSGRPDFRLFAGRSKKKADQSSGGRIEGDAEARREMKKNARRKSQKLAESLFYRLKNPHKNFPDNFSKDDLEMIGLGYDRLVRFMEKDDPNLKHPYDWYKYGEFGPYSWRGVVLGDPIQGRFSDENVTLMGGVKDHEEFEKIEQHNMAVDFGKRIKELDTNVGRRHFWVFVRHPKWRITDLPWEQWTLVSEVVVEAGKQRLDKWNLMGRLGNKTRSLITQCAAWFRPDIVYVKRPVYQCRFEPQDEFFKSMIALLDPETEHEFMCQVENDDGSTQLCTYFEGLCKIVKVNQKAFVDDVVKGYEKLSDEKKAKCLGFLFNNHPNMLLHPFTKEWKAKLEEYEMGCDAPDDDDDRPVGNSDENLRMDWIESDGGDDDNDNDEEEEEEDEDVVVDVEGRVVSNGDEEDSSDEEDEKEDEKYWENEFQKAMRSNEGMENLAKRSVEMSTKVYEKQAKAMEERENAREKVEFGEGDELETREDSEPEKDSEPEEWKTVGRGPYKKMVKKSRFPPELFLKAAVRPFTYRNLVKEIVLTRHALVEGEIGQKKK